jgi:zinc protease
LWFQSPEGGERRAKWAKTTTATSLRNAENPKVYIAAGNCLIGDVMRTSDSLAVAWMSYQGVNQFVGYTVPTWFGKGGWGTLEMWQEYAGQITLAEAFYLNNQRLVHKLVTDCPKLAELSLSAESLSIIAGERRAPPTTALRKMSAALKDLPQKEQQQFIGYLYDRDTVAFYGDPTWDARADGSKAQPGVRWEWSTQGGRQVVTLTSANGFKKDDLLLLLPHRLKGGKVAGDAGLSVMLKDKFVRIDHPNLEAGKSYRIELEPAAKAKT